MKYLGFASITSLGLFAATALAQDTVYVGDDEEVVVTERTRPMIGIAVGGGVSGFTDDTMRETTDDGGNWNARLSIGTNSPLTFEASYIGSAQSIDAFGLDNDAVLLGNGATGVVRLNASLGYSLDPFVFAGIGWRRYDIVDSDTNTSALLDSDDVGEVPVGVGVAGRWGNFHLDLRGEYDYAFGADMVPSVNDRGDDADMHRYGVALNLGLTM